jgi:hypothetical protein
MKPVQSDGNRDALPSVTDGPHNSKHPVEECESGRMKLAKYRAKRNFDRTAEPSGEHTVKPSSQLLFVVQKHAAPASL